MDVVMPEMTGTEASREIRKMNINSVIVAISSLTASEDIEACFNSGINDFSTIHSSLFLIVPKPIRARALLKTLVRWLGN